MRYGVSVGIHSECGKIRTRKTPNKDTFHAVKLLVVILLVGPQYVKVAGKIFIASDFKASIDLCIATIFLKGAFTCNKPKFILIKIHSLSQVMYGAYKDILVRRGNNDAFEFFQFHNMVQVKHILVIFLFVRISKSRQTRN